jgi:retinoblastoma-like protein 1
MPPEFRVKIDRVERNFTVSMVVFKKYQPIFVDMFRNPVDEQLRQPRSRKQRLVPAYWIICLVNNMKFDSLYRVMKKSLHLMIIIQKDTRNYK